MSLFLEAQMISFFFLPLGQIFSASQWITCGCHMLENVSEGRCFWCWLPFSDATLVMHGMCDIWNLICCGGVSYSKQIYLSLEYPMRRNCFLENQASIFLKCSKKIPGIGGEAKRTRTSLAVLNIRILQKLLLVWHNLPPSCI